MKSIVKIISLAVALVWINSATAETEAAYPASAVPKIPVAAKPEKVDRAQVEKRLLDRAARTKKRTAAAEKAVADREAQAQQTRASGASK